MRDPRDVVRAYYETVWSRGETERAAEFLAPDVVDHDPLPFPDRRPGADGVVQVVGIVRAGIPDLERTIEDQIAEGDRVVTRFLDRGTHAGELLGIAPTGRAVVVRGINIERVSDGRITELWHIEDIAGLVAQITAGS
jgi:steroid delta-isomerase-like uncharacterized protein